MAIPAEAITTNAVPVEKAIAVKIAKMTRTQKIVAKKIEKQIKKANSPEGEKAAKENDTLSLLSLIFGRGPEFIYAISAELGFLLGIADLILGRIGLGRVKKCTAPKSSKILALLGLILGGLVTLIGLGSLFEAVETAKKPRNPFFLANDSLSLNLE